MRRSANKIRSLQNIDLSGQDRHKPAALPKITNHLSYSEAHRGLPAEVWPDLSDSFEFKPLGPPGEIYTGLSSEYGTLQARSGAVVAAGRTELWDIKGCTCAVRTICGYDTISNLSNHFEKILTTGDNCSLFISSKTYNRSLSKLSRKNDIFYSSVDS